MRVLFTILAIVIANSLLAQFQIKGKVVSTNQEVLSGASVIVTGTTNGKVTDEKGEFTLTGIGAGQVKLTVAFIGHKRHIEKIDLKSDVELTIVLEEEAVLTEAIFVYATRSGSTTPFASSTIEKEELKSRNMGQDIPYLLSSTPSFVSTSDAGTGVGYTGFRIRGTDANRINVTINGIPLNDAESHGVFWVNMPDFSSSIENVQIQRGVGTSTNGAAAFGATINMQTNTLQKDAYATYNGAAGSFNTLKNTVQIGTGFIADHFSFDARLSKISSDGFIDRASSNLKSYYLSGGYFTEHTIAKLNIFSGNERTYQAWNGVPSVRLNNDTEGMNRYGDHGLYSEKQTQEMIAANPRTYNLYTYENETDNYQQDHYQLMLSHLFSPLFSINIAGHYTRGLGYYEQFKPNHKLSNYGWDPVKIDETTISRTDIIRQKWLDNHFYGSTVSLHYNNNQSEITLGGGWNQYIGHHYGTVIWARLFGDHQKGDEWYRNRGDKTDYNAYLKYNYAVSSQLNLYADVQYRGINFSIDGIDDDLRDITQEHRFDFVNPKLGLFYQPDQNQKAYISWAVANREPNRSNYTDADPAGKQPVAERLNDYEAGYSFSTTSVTLGANLYYMQYKDQLIMTGEINDVGSAIMVNVDESYRTGIELIAGIKLLTNLRWDVNTTLSRNKILKFIEHVDNWDTWGQETFDLNSTDIAFSPNLIANSTFTYNAFKNLSVGLFSQYVGEQFIDNSSSDDRKLDAYLVNNLRVGYTLYPHFAKEIEFTLLVNNLLNHEYETNAWVYSYLMGGERFKMDGYYPQAGINFMVGVNISF